MPFVEMILALGSRMSIQCLSLPDIVRSSKLPSASSFERLRLLTRCSRRLFRQFRTVAPLLAHGEMTMVQAGQGDPQARRAMESGRRAYRG
jgi:hypothetical protein